MLSLIRLSLRTPYLICSVALCLSIISLWPLSQMKSDNAFHIWFDEDATVFSQYEAFKQTFSNDENILIFYRNDNLFSQKQLQLNRDLSEQLLKLENVIRVHSLATVQIPGLVEGELDYYPFLPNSISQLEQLQELATHNSIIAGNLISRDAKATLIKVELQPLSERANAVIMKNINTVLVQEKFKGNHYHVTGVVPILTEMNRITSRETGRFVSLTLLVIALLLALVFRSLRLVLVAIIVAVVSTCWTLALYVVAGNSFSMVSGIIPMVILVISVADTVHIFSQFEEHRIQGLPHNDALEKALRDVVRPCLFTSLTTAVAFLAFLISDIPPLASLGIFTAIGIMIPYLLSFSLLPALLSIFCRLKAIRQFTRLSGSNEVHNKPPTSELLSGAVIQHRFIIIGLCFGMAIFSIMGLQRIQFDTDQIKNLTPSNPIRQANEAAQSWFDGIYPFEIVIASEQAKGFLKVDNIAIVQRIQDHIETLPAIKNVFSAIQFVQSIHHLSGGEKKADIRDIDENLIKMVLQQDNHTMRAFLSEDTQQMRISVRALWLNNQELESLFNEIEQFMQALLPQAKLHAQITGHTALNVNLNQRLIEGQKNSFVLSFILIFVMMLLLFRRFSIAIVAMIPNLLPIVTTLGVMAWLGIKLDVATVLIAAISLGIAIDDSIHLLHAYFHQVTKHKNSITLVTQGAFALVGKPLLITSVILIAGFSMLMFSSFVPLFYFGVFFSINVFLAYFYDIILLPAVISFLPIHDKTL